MDGSQHLGLAYTAQFAKEMKLVIPKAQRLNCGKQVWLMRATACC